MKLYSVSDKYINYLRTFDTKVYDNKETSRKTTRKYLGIVLNINGLSYYIHLSSPKKSDYKNNNVRKSIIPIIRIISNDETTNSQILKGTLRLSNMIPVPENELILYEQKYEKNKNYRILIEKQLEFISKNKDLIKKSKTITSHI